MAKFCPYCGKPVKNTDKFCIICGKPLLTDISKDDAKPQTKVVPEEKEPNKNETEIEEDAPVREQVSLIDDDKGKKKSKKQIISPFASENPTLKADACPPFFLYIILTLSENDSSIALELSVEPSSTTIISISVHV